MPGCGRHRPLRPHNARGCLMICVDFRKSEDGKSISITLQGHAGYGEKGKDIVCAAASILAYTVAQVVTDLYSRKKLKKKPTVRLEEGNICVVCKPRRGAWSDAMAAYDVAQVGYRLLAESYPENVRVKGY